MHFNRVNGNQNKSTIQITKDPGYIQKLTTLNMNQIRIYIKRKIFVLKNKNMFINKIKAFVSLGSVRYVPCNERKKSKQNN